MSFVPFFIPLLFQLLLFTQNTQLQPTYTSEPSNPSEVEERRDLILQWNYDLDGQSNLATRIVNITAGESGAPNVATRQNDDNATVEAGYENLFRATINNTQATLTILAAPKSIHGEIYQLRILTASPNFFNLQSGPVEISVLFKPEDVQLLTNASANQACLGSYLNVNCSVGSANPPAIFYQLLKNDVVVDTSSSGMWIRMLLNSGVFTYKCLANNTEGTANSTSVIITVGVPPTIQPLQNKAITEGGNLNLSCNASGTPPPFVSWVRISSGQQFNGSLLQLTNVNKNQAGDYRCKASNNCGTKSSTATIHVKFKPSAMIQQCPTPVTEGNNATLFCNATGYPVPNIEWINASSGNVVSRTKTLPITAITRSESGNYTCHASNEIGNDTQPCEIDVYYLPSDTALTTTPTNTTVLHGSTVSLNCSTDANPAAHVYQFYFNNSFINNSISGVLNITVDTDGVYTCVPINTVGTGRNATVSITVVVAPTVEISNTMLIVVEGSNVTLSCHPSGIPTPIIRWIRLGDSKVFPQGSSISVVNVTRPGTPDNMIRYQCTASNGVKSPAKAVVNITVHYRPSASKITTGNRTVLRGSSVSLNCATDASPPAYVYHFYFNGNFSGSISSGVFNHPVQEDGLFTCVPINSVGLGDSATLSVTVVDAPLVEINTTFETVVEGQSITLYCNATGKPKPTITWTKVGIAEVLANNATFVTGTLNRNDTINNTIQYQCTGSNGVENPATDVANVTVHYSPVITEPQEDRKQVEKGGVCECKADGNPPPEYSWKNATGAVLTTNNTLMVTEDGNYTCVAENGIGSDTHRIFIEIKESVHGVDLTIPQPYQKWYNDLNDTRTRNFTKPLENGINATYKDNPTFGNATVVRLRNGSVNASVEKRLIASVFIYFKTPVTVSEGLADLRSAIRNGTIGPYTVTDLKVIEVFEVVNPTFTTVVSNTASTNAPVTRRKNITSSSKDGPPWAIIGAVIGGVVVLIVITVVMAWWVHKKRKCRRKGTKIHNSESEVLQGQSDMEDGAYARVNGGYADAGPPSANGTSKFVQQPQPQPEQQQQQEAAAPPAYAVVDKSTKKTKKGEAEDPYAEVEDPKKDKKTADPSTHDYAVVNKSKKKKKEADENAYATVDKSKKSKKGQQKPKAPGEVLYADLDDFKPVQAPSMPTVSTSPEPLAPLKRPTPYQGTEYADITQFLKGNATLPEGQSTEMQPTYANAGGGQGAAANKENPNTGGEGGGGDTEPKETPM